MGLLEKVLEYSVSFRDVLESAIDATMHEIYFFRQSVMKVL